MENPLWESGERRRVRRLSLSSLTTSDELGLLGSDCSAPKPPDKEKTCPDAGSRRSDGPLNTDARWGTRPMRLLIFSVLLIRSGFPRSPAFAHPGAHSLVLPTPMTRWRPRSSHLACLCLSFPSRDHRHHHRS